MGYAIVAILLLALTFWILRLRTKAKVVTRRISNPSLGVLCLAGAASEAAAAVDLAQIAPLFHSVERSDKLPPSCDVLLVYCEISPDGHINNTNGRLREIIRDAGASVVVVATEHPVERYIATTPPQVPFGRTNLMMTLVRNDPSFSKFLVRLFSEMKSGVPLPLAWHHLTKAPAPVAAGGIPEMIFASEIGPITFA
jgi:hypothetical protein